MGKADIAVNQWLGNNQRFASLCNGALFGGQEIVRPEELEDLKREADILITDKNGKTKGVQRHRDIVKRWRGGTDLAVLACESQNKIHYAMPVRNMLYDSLAYAEQIHELWRREKGGENRRKPSLSPEEYLSGFRKGDRIYPVITLVFYYDVKPWDGAKDLYEMFLHNTGSTLQEAVKRYVPNYPINLIDAGHIEDSTGFCADLQHVFDMLKYRESKADLQRYIQRNEEYFSSVDVETYQALCSFLNVEKELARVGCGKEEKVNMCRAMEEWYQDAVKEGREEGRVSLLHELIRKKRGKGLSIEEIAEDLEADKETVRKIVEAMQG